MKIRIMQVTYEFKAYDIPEMWLIGRQQVGRTLRDAIRDWVDQEPELLRV